MKLLLHMCCGPCAVFPVEKLRSEGIELDGYFFNPNIHPILEYEKRKSTLIQFAQSASFHVYVEDACSQKEWEDFQGTESQRCRMCYEKRLNQCASFAKLNGYEAFTSTLFVSPYQNHELMKEIAMKAADNNEVGFMYFDFREGFRKGQQQARDLGLYRQKYCGCIKSLR